MLVPLQNHIVQMIAIQCRGRGGDCITYFKVIEYFRGVYLSTILHGIVTSGDITERGVVWCGYSLVSNTPMLRSSNSLLMDSAPRFEQFSTHHFIIW